MKLLIRQLSEASFYLKTARWDFYVIEFALENAGSFSSGIAHVFYQSRQ
jgi:hypothetical protein